MLELEGFQLAIALDLNMGFNHIELCPHNKQIYTIFLPWGMYEYQVLPIRLNKIPDIFIKYVYLI